MSDNKSPLLRFRAIVMVALLWQSVVGCDGSSGQPANSYSSFEPKKRHWAIELIDTGSASKDDILSALAAADGIVASSIVVNTEAGYVSFETTSSSLETSGEVKSAAVAALDEIGVKTGKTKTRL